MEFANFSSLNLDLRMFTNAPSLCECPQPQVRIGYICESPSLSECPNLIHLQMGLHRGNTWLKSDMRHLQMPKSQIRLGAIVNSPQYMNAPIRI